MELTKEEALKYYRQMLTEMQEKLGNTPSISDRVLFKKEWCEKHFPGEAINNDCFLCEFSEYMRKTVAHSPLEDCIRYCPIDWGKAGMEDCCDPYGPDGGLYYHTAPISEILALPEREIEDVPNG